MYQTVWSQSSLKMIVFFLLVPAKIKKHKNALHQLENLYKIQEVIIQKATAMYGEPLALTL